VFEVAAELIREGGLLMSLLKRQWKCRRNKRETIVEVLMNSGRQKIGIYTNRGENRIAHAIIVNSSERFSKQIL